MSTPSVQRSTSDVVVPTSTPPEKFEVPGGRREAQAAAEPEKQRTVVPNSSFEALKRWNEGPLRRMADDAIKAAGGSDLSQQDKEALRRNIFVLTQGGDFNQEGVVQALKGLIAGLRDPQKAEAIRSDLWTQQAQAFGGMYVPDQYKQAVRSRLEGASGEPSPDAPVVPEGEETDVPVDTQETPTQDETETESAEPPKAPVTSAARSGMDAMKMKAQIEREFQKLAKGKTLDFGDLGPLFTALKLPEEAKERLKQMLTSSGTDPNAIDFPGYTKLRIAGTQLAGLIAASNAQPGLPQDKLQELVQAKLPQLLERTAF